MPAPAPHPRPRHTASVADLATAVLRDYTRRCPGAGRAHQRPQLIGIDGRSGSGKTRTAAALRDLLRRALALKPEQVGIIALEDMYRGWTGLRAGLRRVCPELLLPLSRGEAGRYRRWDWGAGEPAEQVALAPAPVIIVEGVGALTLPCRALYATTIWVSCPATLRKDRALRRDGSSYAPYWDLWAQQEAELYASAPVWDSADLVFCSAQLPGG